MKFAKQLRDGANAKYAGYYANYKYLKKQLNSTQAAQSSSLTTVLLVDCKEECGAAKKSDFQGALELELLKLESFLNSKAFQVKAWTNTFWGLGNLY
eukprot:4730607-Pyramimonas_sp.AAC.1